MYTPHIKWRGMDFWVNRNLKMLKLSRKKSIQIGMNSIMNAHLELEDAKANHHWSHIPNCSLQSAPIDLSGSWIFLISKR